MNSNRTNEPASKFLLLILAAVPSLATSPLHATTKNWNVASGGWNTPGNWDPTGVPGAGDDVYITNGAGPSITYDYAGPDVMLNGLALGADSGTSMFTMSANNLTVATNEDLTSNGDGIPAFVQSGGVNTMAGLRIASYQQYSSYSLTGGSLNAGLGVQVGNFVVNDWRRGFLSVSGSGILTTGGISVAPKGNFQSGASQLTLTSGGTINTGDLFNAGAFQWTGGTLNITKDITWDGIMNPAGSTSGLFGDFVQIDNNRTLGITGNETLGGGDSFAMVVGDLGTHTVSGTLKINSGSHLKLDNGILNPRGILNVGGLNLGGDPTRLNWIQGTVHLLNSVTWDDHATATSTSAAFGHSLTLDNHKTLSITGDEKLGSDDANGGFNLTVNTIGTNSVSGTLTINVLGELWVNGGTVTAGSLHNLGILTADAGTLSVGDATLGSSGGFGITLTGTNRGTQYRARSQRERRTGRFLGDRPE